MSISLIAVCAILLAHWIGDFIFQSDYHAVNKSKSNRVLFAHVMMYSVPLYFVGLLLLPINYALIFVAINVVAHFITDYFTSRITSKLWQKNDRHNFFVVIGLDQMLHAVVLFASFAFFASL
jgi:membrane-bound metal-dependent hydrolase YbcI (DUF457 family)